MATQQVATAELSMHRLGVICALSAGVWLGSAEAPTKLVSAGFSPFLVSLVMVMGVFTARWTVPTLLQGTDRIFSGRVEQAAPDGLGGACRGALVGSQYPHRVRHSRRWTCHCLSAMEYQLSYRTFLGLAALSGDARRGGRELGACARRHNRYCDCRCNAGLGDDATHWRRKPSCRSRSRRRAGRRSSVGNDVRSLSQGLPERHESAVVCHGLHHRRAGHDVLACRFIRRRGSPIIARIAQARPVAFWLFLGGFCWVIGDLFQQYAAKYIGIGRGIPLSNTNQSGVLPGARWSLANSPTRAGRLGW